MAGDTVDTPVADEILGDRGRRGRSAAQRSDTKVQARSRDLLPVCDWLRPHVALAALGRKLKRSIGLNCHRGSVDGAAVLHAALPVTYSTGARTHAFALRVSPRHEALRLSGAGHGVRTHVCWAVHVCFFVCFFLGRVKAEVQSPRVEQRSPTPSPISGPLETREKAPP